VGDAAAWTKLGFHVDPQTPSSPSPVVRLGDVVIRFSQSTLASSQAESTTTTGFGLQRLGFKGLPDGVNEIGGIPVYRCDGPLSGHPSAAQQINHHHPNTASGIDHVVLYAKHEEDLIKSFAKAGIELKKRVEIFEDVVQLFFRPGQGTILEVLVNHANHNHVWGLTVTVDDIQAARARLPDECASHIRDARQKGRKILTIRHEAVGLNTAMAWMTPHVKKASI